MEIKTLIEVIKHSRLCKLELYTPYFAYVIIYGVEFWKRGLSQSEYDMYLEMSRFK